MWMWIFWDQSKKHKQKREKIFPSLSAFPLDISIAENKRRIKTRRKGARATLDKVKVPFCHASRNQQTGSSDFKERKKFKFSLFLSLLLLLLIITIKVKVFFNPFEPLLLPPAPPLFQYRRGISSCFLPIFFMILFISSLCALLYCRDTENLYIRGRDDKLSVYDWLTQSLYIQ